MFIVSKYHHFTIYISIHQISKHILNINVLISLCKYYSYKFGCYAINYSLKNQNFVCCFEAKVFINFSEFYLRKLFMNENMSNTKNSLLPISIFGVKIWFD